MVAQSGRARADRAGHGAVAVAVAAGSGAAAPFAVNPRGFDARANVEGGLGLLHRTARRAAKPGVVGDGARAAELVAAGEVTLPLAPVADRAIEGAVETVAGDGLGGDRAHRRAVLRRGDDRARVSLLASAGRLRDAAGLGANT